MRVPHLDNIERRPEDALARQANEFLSSFRWVGGIREAREGIAIPGVIGVFLFHIAPARDDVDEWLWVIVGDVPPAYLVMDDAQHPAQALRLYIDEMQLWVDAVRAGQPTTDLIPVNAPATVTYADMLASRLAFLRDRVLSDYA